MRRQLLLYLLLLFWVSYVNAETADNIFPNYNGTCVNDFATLIAPRDSKRITSLCNEITQEGLASIVICTISSIPKVKKEYENIVLYGTDLFNYWRIGRNGVLVVISKKDRKAAICTGYLTEHFLPDPEVGRILRTYMFPNFKKGDYGKGIIEGIVEARKVMEKNRMLMYPEKYKNID